MIKAISNKMLSTATFVGRKTKQHQRNNNLKYDPHIVPLCPPEVVLKYIIFILPNRGPPQPHLEPEIEE